MRALVTTDAIVLRSIAYGESDRVVTLFGRATGRVSALARGARKSSRRFGGGLGLAATGEATLRERAGAELASLESFDVREPHVGLAGDLARTAHAAYALELVEKLCAPRQPEPVVYDWLDQLLHLVAVAGASAERLRAYELGLLARLGFGPELGACVSCGSSAADDEAVRWQPERGGWLCRGCGRTGALLSAPVRRALARLGTSSLADAQATPLARDVNAGCRRAIHELLEPHLTGPLKSVEFLMKMGAT